MSDDVRGMGDRLRCWAAILSCEEGKENALKEIGECADYFDHLRDLLTKTHSAITTGKKKERLDLAYSLWEARQKLFTYKGTDE